MIKITREPDSPKWAEWKQRCTEAKRKLIVEYRLHGKVAFNEDLYKEQRDTLYELFYGKCAYCECDYGSDQHKGDVEHYRPKGAVRSAAGKVAYAVESSSGELKEHPGYYWLAYDWRNLLPSCQACNRRAKNFGGETTGKASLFAISGTYVMDPELEPIERLNEQERPLLLNPRYDDPSKHFRFDVKKGVVCPTSPRGEYTKKILGLNRDRLPERRRHLIDSVILTYRMLRDAIETEDAAKRDKAAKAIRKIREGDFEFSAFANAQLDVLNQKLTRISEAIAPEP
jgi:hypothetical protein